jgi:AP-3 complex subunit mu
MLDAGGHPLTTSPNALRDIVLPPTTLSKLLAVANITTPGSNAGAAGVFSSPIPWRKSNVKHSTNEIYFDIAEEMVAVVSK